MNKIFLKVIIVFLLGLSFQVNTFATHAIGADIQVSWTGNDNFYLIRLNMYENEKSIHKYGYGVELTQKIYFATSVVPSTNNTYINQLDLSLVSNGHIETDNNFCATNEVVETNLLVYSKVVDLSNLLGSYGSTTFYVTWEYCCRNEDITNISDPSNTLLAIYTQCPPLSYLNHSAVFKPLKNEYFCRNTLSTFDMSATDIDGDRLRYKIVPPLQKIDPLHITSEVNWLPGYSANNSIPGSVSLTIDANTGILTFNPFFIGIFTFSISVEEYRGNVKIGEVKKDYQFNVQNCPVNYKPVISFKENTIKENDTLIVQLKGSTCFPMYVTDYDATKFFLSETIFIHTKTILPINSNAKAYPKSAFTIPTTVSLTGLRDTSRFNACFSPCDGGLKLDETTYYQFQLIINDDKCPAKYDTLTFTIKVEVNPNALPEVFIDPPTNPKKIKVNESLVFNVFGRDADADDLLSLRLLNPQTGMHFRNVQDSSSTISSTFSWQPDCNDLNPGLYTISFLIKDNSCLINHTDTVSQSILVYQDDVSFDDMEVTNLITPNGDGFNDAYYIPGIPLGNCYKYFKGIEIYNRWGSRVFYSQDRMFNWYPDVSDGMYYFAIDLNYEVRKGWLQIIH